MKSQLEEAKQEIKELLKKYGFSTCGVGINPTQTDKIIVESKRDDMPEGKEISMIITRRSEQDWSITMSENNRPCNHHPLKDKEEVLKFIEKKLQELVKCCG